MKKIVRVMTAFCMVLALSLPTIAFGDEATQKTPVPANAAATAEDVVADDAAEEAVPAIEDAAAEVVEVDEEVAVEVAPESITDEVSPEAEVARTPVPFSGNLQARTLSSLSLNTLGFGVDFVSTIIHPMLPGFRSVDIPAHSTAMGTQAVIWQDSLAANQRFRMEKSADGYIVFYNVETGYCLDIKGGQLTPGNAVIQWPFKNSLNQKWLPVVIEEGDLTVCVLVSAITAENYDAESLSSLSLEELSNNDDIFVLDVKGGIAANGSSLIIWPFNGNDNQLFGLEFPPAPLDFGGEFLFKTAVPGVDRALDIAGASKDNGAALLLWDTHGYLNQWFDVIYIPETGYYSIINQRSGKALDVTGASMYKGAQVIQWGSHNGFNQQWSICWANDDPDSALVHIVNAGSGLALDLTGGVAVNGGKVIQWPTHNGSNQQWDVYVPLNP
ncbi:MAG: RICIN domain-containing protein [Coriobacteriales bacterium]|jgi:hypothetical protein|nr:RICIN domain-containing protein [Coriobacteriales bacterium]